MTWRFACALTLIVLVGCGRPDSPAPIARKRQPANSGQNNRPVATIESLTFALQHSIQNENNEAALKFAELALGLEPDNISMLLLSAQLAQNLGMTRLKAGGDRETAGEFLIRSADFMRRIQKTGSKLNDLEKEFMCLTYYHEVCAQASKDDLEKAMAALIDAVEVGFKDYRLVESNADLADLRKTQEYQDYFGARREEDLRRRLAIANEKLAGQQSFEFDFDLVSTNGNSIKLADYKGKVLIVDFWGTWCPPCLKEIPHFVELLKNHQEAGLEIVGINYERGDATKFKDNINDFAKEFGVTYPCLLGDEVTRKRVKGLNSFPTTLFIDPSGKVRLMVKGYHPYDHLEAIVLALLAEAGDSPDN
jgi:thiol-disulfide isomerase/thioredoxin